MKIHGTPHLLSTFRITSFLMEPHGLSPWGSTKIPSYAKAPEGYPPLAKSAEATSFNTSRVEAQVTHSPTGRARGLLRRRIRGHGFIRVMSIGGLKEIL